MFHGISEWRSARETFKCDVAAEADETRRAEVEVRLGHVRRWQGVDTGDFRRIPNTESRNNRWEVVVVLK